MEIHNPKWVKVMELVSTDISIQLKLSIGERWWDVELDVPMWFKLNLPIPPIQLLAHPILREKIDGITLIQITTIRGTMVRYRNLIVKYDEKFW